MEVFKDEEFRRILALPRRPQDWSADVTDRAVKLISSAYGKTGRSILPIQARALVEYADTGTLVGEIGAGFGKAQPLDEVVYTPVGPKPIGEVSVGDVVLSEKGTGVEVVGIFPQGKREILEVSFSDGTTVRCCKEHLWKVRSYRNRERSDRVRRGTRRNADVNDGWEILTAGALSKSIRTTGNRVNWEVPIAQPCFFSQTTTPVDPYTLGVILGDGCTRFNRVEVTSGVRDKEFMVAKLQALNPNTAVRPGAGKVIRFESVGTADLRPALKALGVMGKKSFEKRVPHEYKYAAQPAQRLALLQGLMDTDGWIDKTGAINFGSTSIGLVEDLIELVQALGGLTAPIRSRIPKIPGRDTVYRRFYSVTLQLPPGMCPVTLPFKVARFRGLSKYRLQRRIVAVTAAGEQECVCIAVDSHSHLYLTTGFVVTHNTLTSFLASQIGIERFGKQRVLLVVPAKLRLQTLDVHAEWSKHFRVPPMIGVDETGTAPIRLISYESLSVVSKATFLDEWRPDLVIADEAHLFARMKSARTKRMFRYIRAARKSGLDVHFLPLSGTMRRKSMKECAHIFEAALGEMSPIPKHWPTLESWSFCLDEGVDDMLRYEPGALLALCEEDEKADLAGWRRAFRRRLVETPGVVATSESAVDVPLILQVRKIAVPSVITDALQHLRDSWELPNGDEADSAITVWQQARQLANGFSYKWDPPGPPEWLEARRNWNSFVRATIESPPKGMTLDSPLQVWQAVAAGKLGYVPEQEKWKAVRETFKPNPVPVWLSDFLVKDAEEWALSTGGIVWVGHTSALEKDGVQDDEDLGKGFTRIPYFGAGDTRILKHRGPCAASIRSFGTGANLQQWNRALIACIPSSGATLEQLLARHHRVGQEADIVHVEVYLHTSEMADALETAQRDAGYMQDTGGQPQRVLSANILDEDGHTLDLAAYRKRVGW